MGKLNCWNFKKCGRYPGGPKAEELGVCPAAEMAEADGYLGGRNGGRACMYIAGTFCGGVVQGTADDKAKQCARCEYYKSLKREFGTGMTAGTFTRYVRENERPGSFTPRGRAWVPPGG